VQNIYYVRNLVALLPYTAHNLAVGSGKSKVLNAVLWYLFQHDATHLALVTSYTWKAATLVGSRYNPGYSSCTTFGINPRKAGCNEAGVSVTSQAIFIGSVRVLIMDEVGFTPQEHMAVSHSSVYVMRGLLS
jgi:hypothetical protein